MLNFTDCLRLFSVFQLVALTLFYGFYISVRSIPHRLMIGLLIIYILILINGFELKNQIPSIKFLPCTYYLEGSLILALSPTLFCFIRSLKKDSYKLSGYHWLETIPSILFALLGFSHCLFSDESKIRITKSYDFNALLYSHHNQMIVLFFIFVSFLIYAYRIYDAFRREFVLKKNHRKQNSLIMGLNPFILSFILMWIVQTIESMRTISNSPTDWMDFFYLSIIYILVNTMVFEGLKKPNSPITLMAVSCSSSNTPVQLENPAHYLKRLETFMRNQKPYLNPEINIKQLARGLSLPQRKLSSLINNHLNKNFFDFINTYRVEASKQLLSNHAHRDKTISEILYEVGFNSKSSFNCAFKKHTGMTPSEYKQVANQPKKNM